MLDELRHALEGVLDARVVSTRRLGGGDINEAFAVRLDAGAEVFVKTNAHADPRMFDREARGLRWLAEAEALRVPRVVAVSDPAAGGPSFLVLELVATRSRCADYDARLGQGLARLHRSGADGFGLSHDNFIGDLPQDNTPCETWPTFYVSRRLEPQLRRAIDSRRAPAEWVARFDRLFARMDRLTGPQEPPARLHGDLWGGNVHVDDQGAPCLIDPAVYGGHREIDLAMLRLFGSPRADFWKAYDEVYPLGPDASARVGLYQLYPLLVHVNLFGGSYGAAVEATLDGYV